MRLIRYELLSNSSYEPLAKVARKIKGELRYHVMHADAFIPKLAQGTEESRDRIHQAMEDAIPFALGIFEPGNFEKDLIADGIFEGEVKLQSLWEEKVGMVLAKANLPVPEWGSH